MGFTNKKKCIAPGCTWPIFSHKYCKSHQHLRKDAAKEKSDLRKVEKRQKDIVKHIEKVQEKAEYTVVQFAEFQKFYDAHPTKRCFECDAHIPVCRSYSVHHCLPKQTYEDIKLDWRYWELVCFRCHSRIETNIDFAPKTKAHTEELLKLYDSENGEK